MEFFTSNQGHYHFELLNSNERSGIPASPFIHVLEFEKEREKSSHFDETNVSERLEQEDKQMANADQL